MVVVVVVVVVLVVVMMMMIYLGHSANPCKSRQHPCTKFLPLVSNSCMFSTN